MVKITQTPSTGPTTVSPAQRSHQVEPSEPLNKDADSPARQDKPFVERRRGDRRRSRGTGRGPYDMRSGRDRRKNSDRGKSVDVDA